MKKLLKTESAYCRMVGESVRATPVYGKENDNKHFGNGEAARECLCSMCNHCTATLSGMGRADNVWYCNGAC